ncbi:hypothetical protein ABK040_006223 [Willaertia magna]
MDKPRIIEHVNKSVNWTIYDCKWVPSSARFIVAGNLSRGTGCIHVYSLTENGKDIEKKSEIEWKHPIKCSTFEATSLEERHLACGDYDGNVLIYDLQKQSGNQQPLYKIDKAHDSMINCIDGCGLSYGPPEIITGSKDGCVKIWDVRQRSKAVVSLEPQQQSSSADCWAVCFGNSYNNQERVCACGYENGDLKLFDLRTNNVLWETNIKNGICGLQFDRKDIEMNKLLVTTLEGRFSIFDTRTMHPEKGFAHMTEKVQESASTTVWTGKHLPQNRDVFLVTAGSGLLSLYKYNYPPQRKIGNPAEGVAGTVTLLNKTTVSSQPVICLDWNRDKEGLAIAGSLDQCIRVIVVTKLNKI